MAAATAADSDSAENSDRKHQVLISNDDGIQAPGLRALVTALATSGAVDVYVCAPSGERSAQSHAITLGRYLSCFSSEVPGAVEAYAVDGTPADAVMLALNSQVFKGRRFDLVVSGINRGDNCGLHVIYSGTVGAAREAACKGVPAIALSLADHKATQTQHYAAPAEVAVTLIEALLESIAETSSSNCDSSTAAGSISSSTDGSNGSASLPVNGSASSPGPHWEAGCVVNVNFPSAAVGPLAGLALTHQGTGCVFPKFLEITEPTGPHLAEFDEHTPNLRVFRNYAGYAREDPSEGSDTWAVNQGWVSVTPLSLRSDVPLRLDPACQLSVQQRSVVAKVVHQAAKKAQLPTFGLPGKVIA